MTELSTFVDEVTTSGHFGDPGPGGTVMAPDTEELSMITVTGLTKRYADSTVVDDVSFTLEPGTVTGFLGPNGAGKTTTMRMITGLVPPTAGEATVGGRRWTDLPNPAAVAGTLLDAGAVHPGRTGPDPPGDPGRDDRRRRPAGSTRCSSWSASATPAGAGSAATRSACGSGSASPPRCSPTRRC